ncbi:hypothetical protein BGE01nite_36760 [Brevifollis gellanilyticus]|uniref:Uncharacterized protein n=2 Tax=Brevifollis gellanilyticus TaxID=748831 RepID=A0A512MCC8_9BACT|nr:hypothetical protein BGE01nite_36760 [Brevifollis gellanilyticus]
MAAAALFMTVPMVVVVMIIMPVTMIVITIMAGTTAVICLGGEEIEEPHYAHANAGDEHHLAENAVRRQIGVHTAADVEIEEHGAPDQHDQDADEVDGGASSGHRSEELRA